MGAGGAAPLGWWRRYGARVDAVLVDGRDGGDGDEDGGGERRSLPAAAGLVGVLVGLVVVLWVLSLTSGDGNSSEGREADPVDEERFVAPTTTLPPPPTEASAETDELREAASVEPFSELEGRLTYLSGSHVATLDLATGALRQVPIETSGTRLEIAGFQLLTDGKRTVGLSATDDPPTAVLLASSAQVVPSIEPLVDFWVVSRPDGPDGAVQLNAWQDYGIVTGELRAPAGAELLVTDAAGVLIVSPAGTTFRPAFAGFEVVSEHRVLAASTGLRVEQRCDQRLNCTVVAVDSATDDAVELPEEFVAELASIHLSPDGRWMLNNTSPAWLLDRHTQELSLLDGGGYGPPRWSDDSTSVAWMTSARTPTLVVARLEPPEGGDDWFVVELAGLGADPSPGSSFLLDAAFGPR